MEHRRNTHTHTHTHTHTYTPRRNRRTRDGMRLAYTHTRRRQRNACKRRGKVLELHVGQVGGTVTNESMHVDGRPAFNTTEPFSPIPGPLPARHSQSRSRLCFIHEHAGRFRSSETRHFGENARVVQLRNLKFRNVGCSVLEIQDFFFLNFRSRWFEKIGGLQFRILFRE